MIRRLVTPQPCLTRVISACEKCQRTWPIYPPPAGDLSGNRLPGAPRSASLQTRMPMGSQCSAGFLISLAFHGLASLVTRAPHWAIPRGSIIIIIGDDIGIEVQAEGLEAFAVGAEEVGWKRFVAAHRGPHPLAEHQRVVVDEIGFGEIHVEG
jgi:hypothetical protein